ncbi:MAG: phage head closure protein [Treponema phagedenis]|uniref:phage head closure protein n=1 Tax=Treponema phagedenis TaxID=162 RepID=UPI003133D36D
MVSEFDISALRKDTEAIIAINPYDVEITRREETEDGYGNIKKIDTVLPKQRMRIAELSHNETERLKQEGVFKNHGVNITALHDADIKKGDKFTFLGNRYKVVFMRAITIGGYEKENGYKLSGHAEELEEES